MGWRVDAQLSWDHEHRKVCLLEVKRVANDSLELVKAVPLEEHPAVVWPLHRGHLVRVLYGQLPNLHLSILPAPPPAPG